MHSKHINVIQGASIMENTNTSTAVVTELAVTARVTRNNISKFTIHLDELSKVLASYNALNLSANAGDLVLTGANADALSLPDIKDENYAHAPMLPATPVIPVDAIVQMMACERNVNAKYDMVTIEFVNFNGEAVIHLSMFKRNSFAALDFKTIISK